ncbi:hypothetical protein ETAA8_70430 [Anatilimnocola aggregata]|uniref:ParB/Sulfiredoxin domain-containing protein n=1 Tax=Anatilimnocola aggregata TaxID=2528021 RepID=A0A517YNT5_9BACT|nr:ParB N-terminal domain-containing protein [Anatilimnocola aggregata]QDU31881.1 hypothetical protein ETAA8_70430 [Anatilimnocola aggregata]
MFIRDRIQSLRRVLARDLQPNPRNWRTHPQPQQDALRALLAEVGYAGALLAREQDDGSLQLIDGHLRAETTPEQLVPVLVLDVTEDEANKLLACWDPLSALAGRDQQRIEELVALIETDSPALCALLTDLSRESSAAKRLPAEVDELIANYQLVVQCADEAEQRELFERLSAEGLSCRVLTM